MLHYGEAIKVTCWLRATMLCQKFMGVQCFRSQMLSKHICWHNDAWQVHAVAHCLGQQHLKVTLCRPS